MVASLTRVRRQGAVRPDTGAPCCPALPPELERTILSIRRRLQAHATPTTCYCLIGAAAIPAELKALGICPLPNPRTIERVLQRNDLTAPRLRLVPLLPHQKYTGFQALASNELHEIYLLEPVYLRGSGQRYSFWICKNVFDGAVCLRLTFPPTLTKSSGSSASAGRIWAGLSRYSWKTPANCRPAARTLSQWIRLCLRFGVTPVFISEGELQYNGPVENFNTWFQEPFLRLADLRRELARLQEAVNIQHVHPRLRGRSPARHRCGLGLQKPPTRFVVPAGKLPLAEGRIIFFRCVTCIGTVTVLSQKFRIGRRHRDIYVRLVVDAGCGYLTAYLNARVLKRWP